MELAIRGFGSMQIGGQERPFMLGTLQARVYCEQQGIELDAYQESVASITATGGLKSATIIEALLYSALVAGAKLRKLPVDFDADEVSFWVAAADAEEIGKLFSVAMDLADTGPGNGAGQPARKAK